MPKVFIEIEVIDRYLVEAEVPDYEHNSATRAGYGAGIEELTRREKGKWLGRHYGDWSNIRYELPQGEKLIRRYPYIFGDIFLLYNMSTPEMPEHYLLICESDGSLIAILEAIPDNDRVIELVRESWGIADDVSPAGQMGSSYARHYEGN